MALWQSDKPIVAMKSCNEDEAKGVTRMQETLRDTSSRLRTGDKTLTKIKSSDLQDGLQGVSLEEPCEGKLHARFCEGH
jgi:sirohydrochlorin ferrochelatase